MRLAMLRGTGALEGCRSFWKCSGRDRIVVWRLHGEKSWRATSGISYLFDLISTFTFACFLFILYSIPFVTGLVGGSVYSIFGVFFSSSLLLIFSSYPCFCGATFLCLIIFVYWRVGGGGGIFFFGFWSLAFHLLRLCMTYRWMGNGFAIRDQAHRCHSKVK